MPLNPAAFTTPQTNGAASILVVTDTSVGTDNLIVSRRVSLQTALSTYLVPTGNASPQYISWPLVNPSISLDVLNKDYGLTVVVQWLDVNGNALYTVMATTNTTGYSEQFAYDLVRNETSNPSILQDENYLMNAMRLRLDIDNANLSITQAADIYNSQQSLDKATYLRTNAKFLY